MGAWRLFAEDTICQPHGEFQNRLSALQAQHRIVDRAAEPPAEHHNGVYRRWVNPVLTAEHAPLFWRYDFDPATILI